MPAVRVPYDPDQDTYAAELARQSDLANARMLAREVALLTDGTCDLVRLVPRLQESGIVLGHLASAIFKDGAWEKTEQTVPLRNKEVRIWKLKQKPQS